VTSKPDFKVMVLLLVFMQLTRDLFAIAKFLFNYVADKQTNLTNRQTDRQTDKQTEATCVIKI